MTDTTHRRARLRAERAGNWHEALALREAAAQRQAEAEDRMMYRLGQSVPQPKALRHPHAIKRTAEGDFACTKGDLSPTTLTEAIGHYVTHYPSGVIA